MLVAGFDVGNSRLSVALVAEDGELVSVARQETPPDASSAVETLATMAEELIGAAGEQPAAAGIGFGGPVDAAAGRVRTSYLTPGWGGLALGEVMADRLGVPAYLANDADAGGLGEALLGAGMGAESVLYVNVGTGIGGAVILNGRIHAGHSSMAGEIGHFLVVPDGPECTCGHRGCLQSVSAGPALAAAAEERLARGEVSTLGQRVGQLTGSDVGEAAAVRDALAVGVVADATRFLAMAIANAVNLIDPAVVVVGGGVTEMGEVLLAPLRRHYRGFVLDPERQAAIVPAALGYDAGVVGAACVALTELGAAESCL